MGMGTHAQSVPGVCYRGCASSSMVGRIRPALMPQQAGRDSGQKL
jgi:hypothetical protein